MFFLIAAGVAIAATVVSWVNGQRTAEVEAKIAELESTLAAILSADAKERKQIAIGYIVAFRDLLESELHARNEIATSLATSLQQAKEILLHRFGSDENDGFLQALLEMELAYGRINSERSQFQTLLDALPASAEHIDLEKTLPTPDDLILQADFPCLGGLLDLSSDKPLLLHGYDISYVDEEGSPADIESGMFISVDHKNKNARVSLRSGALMAPSIADGGKALDATVQSVTPGHVELSYMGARLALNAHDAAQLGKVNTGSRISVYPGVWTLDQLVDRGSRAALQVRLNPRISATREIWSPVSLAISEELLPQLVEAYDALESQGHSHEKWLVHATETGQVLFSQGEVTLVTIVSLSTHAFILEAIHFAPSDPIAPVALYVELHAFVPGTEDDDLSVRNLFPSFVNLLTAELGRTKSMHLQRQSAVRLRKLSLIYQDQQEHLQTESSCGFIVGAVAKNGMIEGTLTFTQVPSWLNRALNSGEASRLRAIGAGHEWKINKAEWIDPGLGVLRFELAGRKENRASPYQITRIELAGEGGQQQTFYRILEQAISGKFVSPAVHHTLMSRGATSVEIKHLGRTSVDALLRSDQPLLAIWGPPGTGKTTMLVDWLLSIFVPGNEAAWPTILITGPTNIAVTKLVSDLLVRAQYLEQELVRYGVAKHVQNTPLAAMWNEALLEPFDGTEIYEGEVDALLHRWHSLLRTREGRESIAKWVLGPRHIHSATCVGMMRRDYGLSRRNFDIAIIDEAGKGFDAELFIPAARARKVVLVGDHFQLPPTVTDEFLNKDIPYRLPLSEVEALLCTNCFQDIFERLPASNKGMLTLQYRMHSDIGNLVSDLFYEGKLESHRAEPVWEASTHRLVFVDFSENKAYKHSKETGQSSPKNETECRALEAMLLRLNDVETAVGKKVLVVCPYKGQRERVLEITARMKLNFSLDATTVDAVQGGEADFVFLLMTRSRGRVEFLLDRNRLNVALSRARDAVYILGHRRCLSPGNNGPVADLIKFGLQRRTLRVIRADGSADNKALARMLFIAPIPPRSETALPRQQKKSCRRTQKSPG
ncbi:DEAD/DEAH box helicase [Duganella sp. BuS-21]|uniref:DEAD/DEAH box helicase n=1 Tax=Duganella sp. BuS-21 TaxID=2943848 RepID=UPI0035A5E97B